MRKAKNWKHFSQTRPFYIVRAKFQNGVIFIKFWELAINYVAKSFIDGKPIFERFENFGTTLVHNKNIFLNSFNSNPSFAWRFIIGPLNSEVTMIIQFCRNFANTYVYLSITEIILIKVVMLYAWKHICDLDETFVTWIGT